MKNKVKSIHTRQKWFIWTMLSVSILHFIVFWIYVNFDAIMLAFKNMDYASGNEYWTLSNFDKVFELFRGGDENVGNVFFHYQSWCVEIYLLRWINLQHICEVGLTALENQGTEAEARYYEYPKVS